MLELPGRRRYGDTGQLGQSTDAEFRRVQQRFQQSDARRGQVIAGQLVASPAQRRVQPIGGMTETKRTEADAVACEAGGRAAEMVDRVREFIAGRPTLTSCRIHGTT